MWFLRPSAPATILQSYDQNISYLSGKPAQNIGHKRFFRTSAASIASNHIIPPADLPRAFAPTQSVDSRQWTLRWSESADQGCNDRSRLAVGHRSHPCRGTRRAAEEFLAFPTET